MGKPVSLAAVKATKPAAAPPPAPVGPDGAPLRNVMFRLNRAGHELLRKLAYAQRKPQSKLLIEAINDLFIKHGEPPVAG